MASSSQPLQALLWVVPLVGSRMREGRVKCSEEERKQVSRV